MKVECDVQLGAQFSSNSQKARVISEAWFRNEGYCLACPSSSVTSAKPNAIARDFICPVCTQTYELKSSAKAHRDRVVDGAFETMLRRIRSDEAPVLLLLQYFQPSGSLSSQWSIRQLTAIHPVFLTDAVVEPRKPLSSRAIRAGWQGCNLRIDRIPADGKIQLIQDGVSVDPVAVRTLYQSSADFSRIDVHSRGWTALVLNAIRRLNVGRFNLQDLYANKRLFEITFPSNRNVEAKIRQQLQILRDLGYISFETRGTYKVVK